MVLRVLWGIFRGQKSEDIRSEDEDEVEDGNENEEGIEIGDKSKRSRQLNVTDLDICVSSGSGGVVQLGGNDASSMRISSPPRPRTNARRRPGVLEKEILNRIGCEKPQ